MDPFRCFKPQICWISKVSDFKPYPKDQFTFFSLHYTFALIFILDDTEIFSVICLQMKLVILIISEIILKLMRKTPKTLPRLFCVPHQQFLLLSLIFVNKQTPLKRQWWTQNEVSNKNREKNANQKHLASGFLQRWSSFY